MTTTRSETEKLMGEIYSKVGLTKEEIKAIVDAGLRSPVTLIRANTVERLEDMAKDSGLTTGTLLELEHLALCLDWLHASAGENFATELTSFSAEKFQAFNPSNPPITAEEVAIANEKEIDTESIKNLSIENETIGKPTLELSERHLIAGVFCQI